MKGKKAFSTFRKGSTSFPNVVWQEHDSIFPFHCDVCKRHFEHGGKRYIASSMIKHSHYAVGCKCADCHAGINPFKTKIPVLSERRTELD